MSNDEFESWLSLVGRLLGLSENQRKQISEELRDHLESRVADLVEDGMERRAAILKAVEEFGDAAVLAKNLQSVSLNNRKRWMMRFMTLATAAMFLVAVLTMAMWPENARFGSPSQSVAQQETAEKLNASDSDTSDPFGRPQKESPKPPPLRPKPKQKPIQLSERTKASNRIRKALSQPYDLVYDAETFGDIRRSIAANLEVNIVIDQNLEGSLDDDTEVTANLVGVPLSQGLRMLLKAVDATYLIKDGVLLIISIDDELEPDYLSRHMYDIREVLQLIKNAEKDRIGKPVAAHGDGPAVVRAGGGGGVFRIAPQLGGGGGGGGGGAGGVAIKQKKARPLLTAERLLIDTITQVISSDSWETNGSGNCNLTCIGGVLVVVSHESLAGEIEDFLADLKFQMKNQD